jgi:hypothetical protein
MDVYARAYSLAKEKPDKYPASYADGFYNKVVNLYDIRFGKAEGVEAWIAEAKKKPLRDPSLPVVPVTDPEPATVAKTTPAATPSTAPAPAAKPTAKKPAAKRKRH